MNIVNAYKKIRLWCSSNITEENIVNFYDYSGWALLIGSAACWVAGLVVMTVTLFVVGLFLLLAGSSV
ncbi:hypothetical protein CH62_4355 (plasmid) [Yersinia pestis]|nr:hypothetical protein CH62_4355 [Yersinia pestis]EDX0932733.1 hypothetical protein [Salmonella enterica subsp. enterica]